MKIYSLDIYKDFKCINSRCKHNCCYNWEIDIDKKTLKKYKRANGDFSTALKNGVDFENSCFKMKNSKCIFLDNDNLCEIIKNKGESYLCQVCTDHPRFRNYFKDRLEIGVGLCCEVIATKIVESKKIVEPYLVKNSFFHRRNTKLEKNIINYRNKIYSILSGDSNFSDKINAMLYNVIDNKEKFLSYNFKEKLFMLEILNEKWKDLFNSFDSLSFNNFDEKYNNAYSNLLFCSIYRHLSNAVDNFDIKSRTLFCVFLVTLIANLFEENKGKFNDKELFIEIIVLTSIELEYSDKNINDLLDVLDNYVSKK